MSNYNYIIAIERPVITRDDFGSAMSTWTKLDDVWASFESLSAKERFEAGSNRVVAVREGRFTIRWRADVDELCRVVYDSMAWGIRGIAEVGYRKGLILHCAADPDAVIAPEPPVESEEKGLPQDSKLGPEKPVRSPWLHSDWPLPCPGSTHSPYSTLTHSL